VATVIYRATIVLLLPTAAGDLDNMLNTYTQSDMLTARPHDKKVLP